MSPDANFVTFCSLHSESVLAVVLNHKLSFKSYMINSTTLIFTNNLKIDML